MDARGELSRHGGQGTATVTMTISMSASGKRTATSRPRRPPAPAPIAPPRDIPHTAASRPTARRACRRAPEMAGHLGGTHPASPEGTDGSDGASRTGQPESPSMVDGDRPRGRRPQRGTFRRPRVGEPWSGRQGSRPQRRGGHRHAHAHDGAEDAGRCRVITGKTRAVWGYGLEDGMTCAAAVSGPTSARRVRG